MKRGYLFGGIGLGMLGVVAGWAKDDLPLPLGQEQIPEGESEQIAKIRDLVADRVVQDYPSGKRVLRDAHPKAHGCVRAKFFVEGDLPPYLRYGVFRAKQEFDAWVRFSSTNGKVQSDQVRDGRGMAIKLLGVPGNKILAEERHEQTQDFVLINHPVFFVRNNADYVELSKAVHEGSALAFGIYFFNPFNLHLREFSLFQALAGHPVMNPADYVYHSLTSYRLGPARRMQAVKYKAEPCRTADPSVPGTVLSDSPDAMREALAQRLQKTEGCYDFYVQRQIDAEKMPIEDSTVLWSPELSPFVKVARLSIPKQKFDSKDQMEFCDNLSFTPWHALPEHRPLGAINRARRVVYQAISELRHRLNGVSPAEPTGQEVFESGLPRQTAKSQGAPPNVQ